MALSPSRSLSSISRQPTSARSGSSKSNSDAILWRSACVIIFILVSACILLSACPTIRKPMHPRLFHQPPYCKGKLVYVYKLPKIYNTDLLDDCSKAGLGQLPCEALENEGLGKTSQYGFIRGGPVLGPGTGWYNSDDIALELYFFKRFKYYPCRTYNPARANAFFVPFFSYLHLINHETGASKRDESYNYLIAELEQLPYLERHGGIDHFMVIGGRTALFKSDRIDESRMLLLSSFQKMIKLTPEKSSTGDPQADKLEVGIPHFSFFHPSSKEEMDTQIDWLSQTEQRDVPVALAVGGFDANNKISLRSLVVKQCSSSSHCALLSCVDTKNESSYGTGPGRLNKIGGCRHPDSVMNLYFHSEFCLHPPGEGFTRKAIFDSLLAGCIPVFFDLKSIELQYTWHLPRQKNVWFIFVSQKQLLHANVVYHVKKISPRKKILIREAIRRFIPGLIYDAPWREYPHTRFHLPKKLSLRRVLPFKNKLKHISNETVEKNPQEILYQTRLKRAYSRKRQILETPDAFDIALEAVFQLIGNKDSVQSSKESEMLEVLKASNKRYMKYKLGSKKRKKKIQKKKIALNKKEYSKSASPHTYFSH